jgi:hypothetical protein
METDYIGAAMVKWLKYFYPLILMKIGGWIEYHSIKMGRKILDGKISKKSLFGGKTTRKSCFTIEMHPNP